MSSHPSTWFRCTLAMGFSSSSESFLVSAQGAVAIGARYKGPHVYVTGTAAPEVKNRMAVALLGWNLEQILVLRVQLEAQEGHVFFFLRG
jgi:hypothetical protein